MRYGLRDVISTPLGAYTLQQPVLSISASLVSTTDPIAGTVSHIGDDLTYEFTVINSGSATARSLQVTATVPTYIQAGSNLNIQFPSSAVTAISSGGTYSAGTPATITWSAGDLDPGSQLTETFTVHLSSDVRVAQSLGIGNNYSVQSTTGQPGGTVTGYTSGAQNISTSVRGPIGFTLTPNASSVAPGGLVTYTATLTNLTNATIPRAAAVITVPQFARFDDSYPTGAKTKVPGISLLSKSGSLTYKQIFWTGNPQPEVVLALGPLYGANDSKHRNVLTFTITFQAQWAGPPDVQTLTLSPYAAGFLDPTPYLNTLTGKKTTRDAAFTAALNTAGTTPGTATAIDFVSFITSGDHEIAYSSNDSGLQPVTVAGSLAQQPNLLLLKAISDPTSSTEDDGAGDGSTDFVQPGDEITFILGVSNFGGAPANDVYLEDAIPDQTTFVSAKLLDSDRLKQSRAVVIQDPDGRHFRIEGLHLEAKDNLSVEYTVRVASGALAPAGGSFLQPGSSTVGSSSTPHTPVGIYLNGQIKVEGTVQFAQPVVRTLVPTPGVSGTDLSVTANALTAIYNKKPSALPLTNPADPLSFIPGVERFYIHYANVGKVAASRASLDFPLPAGTAFYRASFVQLGANQAKGALGYLPGKLIGTPSGDAIVPPAGPAQGFLATGGTVSFTFARLAAGASGDVMVETIVTPNTVHVDGHYGGSAAPSYVVMHDSTSAGPLLESAAAGLHPADPPQLIQPHLSASRQPIFPIDAFAYLLTPQPVVSIWKRAPMQVAPGATFTIQIIVSNFSSAGAHPYVEMAVPPNSEFVSLDCGQSYVGGPSAGAGPGSLIGGILASNNGTVYQNDLTPMLAHTAGVLTITLRATGAVGSTITDTSAKIVVDGMGTSIAPGTATQIVANPSSGMLNVVYGQSLFQKSTDTGDVLMMDLQGGNIVAAGGGNIVAAGGGNIVAAGGGNIVAAGGGNAISIGNDTGANLLASQASIVAAGGGNLIVPGGSNIVAAGGGNIVAAGGGNIVAAGGGNIVAAGGGNIVAAGGGNIVAAGGGNIMAAGGGNIVAAGGGNIVAAGGGNILSSTSGSVAGVVTAAGNIVAAGGGNFLPNQ